MNKVVIVVHGMGEQRQFEISKKVARNLCQASYPPGEHPEHHDCYSNLSVKSDPLLSKDKELLQYRVVREDVSAFAVHEIHWANIAKDYNRPNIFVFFKNAAIRAMKIPKRKFRQKIVYAILIFMMTFVLLIPWLICKYFRMFSSKISRVYEAFWGDVELYSRGDVDDLDYVFGGFDHVYHHVNQRFDSVMSRIGERFEEIYLITHSLGTVLTINRIINAALQDTGIKKELLKKIKLIITFGSPVDKFAALYPNTLVPVFIPRANPVIEEPIIWYNITAYWDPTGGKIDDLFRKVSWLGNNLFSFPLKEILFIGNTIRSRVPALAHTSYWNDNDKELWQKIYKLIEPDDSSDSVSDVMGEGKDSLIIIKYSPFVVTLILLISSVLLIIFSGHYISWAVGLLFFILFILEIIYVLVIEKEYGKYFKNNLSEKVKINKLV